MKYLKKYQDKIFYLTSSGGSKKDLVRNLFGVKTLLHISLDGGFCQLSDTCHGPISKCRAKNINQWMKNEAEHWKKFGIKEVKYFDTECNYDLTKLDDADCIFFHGGDINTIIKNNNFHYELNQAIENCKVYVGFSAGAVIMSQNSFLPKDGGEVKENMIGKDILGVGIFDFGIDVHLDQQLENDIYVENLLKCAKEYRDDFYLLTDGSYLKVQGNEIQKFGTIYTKEDLD